MYRLRIITGEIPPEECNVYRNENIFFGKFIEGIPSSLSRSYSCREAVTDTLIHFYDVIKFNYESPIVISVEFTSVGVDLKGLPVFLDKFRDIIYEVTDNCFLIRRTFQCSLPSPQFISLVLFLVSHLKTHLDGTPDRLINLLLTKDFYLFKNLPKIQIFNAFYLFYILFYNFAYTTPFSDNGPATASESVFLEFITVYSKFYGRYSSLIDALFDKEPYAKSLYRNILWDIEKKGISKSMLELLNSTPDKNNW